MTKKIRTTEPTLKVIRDTSTPLTHVAPDTVEAALGAEAPDKKLEEALAPITLFVNPRTKETFLLLRVDEYERHKEEVYDDSPWAREELEALAWERVEHEDWDEYEDLPERP